MKCLRNLVALLMLVLMMPLAYASDVIANASAAEHACCKQKADPCCKGAAKACCATQAPADTSVFPSQDVARLLLPPRTVPVVHTDRANSLNVQCAARLLPVAHSPPGLLIAATTVLRI